MLGTLVGSEKTGSQKNMGHRAEIGGQALWAKWEVICPQHPTSRTEAGEMQKCWRYSEGYTQVIQTY